MILFILLEKKLCFVFLKSELEPQQSGLVVAVCPLNISGAAGSDCPWDTPRHNQQISGIGDPIHCANSSSENSGTDPAGRLSAVKIFLTSSGFGCADFFDND